MVVDRYTKAVLTVIAGCLLWMCAMNTGWAVNAQERRPPREAPPRESAPIDLTSLKTPVQPVVIVGTGTIDKYGRIQVKTGEDRQTDPTLSVVLPYSAASPMAVEITSIRKTGEWEPIRADVEDAPLRVNPGNVKIRR